jgi:hypothetical protein
MEVSAVRADGEIRTSIPIAIPPMIFLNCIMVCSEAK